MKTLGVLLDFEYIAPSTSSLPPDCLSTFIVQEEGGTKDGKQLPAKLSPKAAHWKEPII